MGPYLGTTVFTVLMIVCIILPLLLAVAYLTYAERKVMAAMQIRRGPNVVGPFGLLQPIADGVKLLFKETIIPSGASRVDLHRRADDHLRLSLVAWAVIPFADGVVLANINVGVLYLFAISSLGVYGIILAGWASNSKYPFLGALRSAAQMVSYEVSIGFVMVTVLLCVGSLNINDIVQGAASIWFCIPLLPMFVVFFISALAETNRPPFDLPEAESELVAGYFLGILGLHLRALLPRRIRQHLADELDDRHPVPRRLAADLGWEPFTARVLTGIWQALWFAGKIAFVAFCFLWVRATFPRYRYDQLMRLGWKVFLPLSSRWSSSIPRSWSRTVRLAAKPSATPRHLLPPREHPNERDRRTIRSFFLKELVKGMALTFSYVFKER
jgi:NADH-quinone oxidoreductase subunit H